GHACFTVGTSSYPGLPTSGETDPRVFNSQPQVGGAGTCGSDGVGLRAAGARTPKRCRTWHQTRSCKGDGGCICLLSRQVVAC
ncbi:unnamed protein product, partial [Ectocarpus sp. 12 AP-2014]